MKTKEGAFQKKSIFARAKMSQAELDKYYEEYRKDRYEKGLWVDGLFWRKVIHPVLFPNYQSICVTKWQRLSGKSYGRRCI